MAASYPQQAPPTYAPYPQQAPPPQYAPQPPVQQTGLPLAGGMLLLIVGVLGIIVAPVVMILGAYLEELMMGYTFGMGTIAIALGVIGVIFSLIVILGGYFATQRTHFGLAIVGGVLSVFVGLIVWFFSGWVLGLIGLILIAAAYKEFH